MRTDRPSQGDEAAAEGPFFGGNGGEPACYTLTLLHARPLLSVLACERKTLVLYRNVRMYVCAQSVSDLWGVLCLF
ncbi:MAG TPA: hypothetical protein PKY01_17505, partial [Candidatus Hydrogenedentes bacterium]|nr:hypothetical protein [Candidatus Hydrogenedentota bacterium]